MDWDRSLNLKGFGISFVYVDFFYFVFMGKILMFSVREFCKDI